MTSIQEIIHERNVAAARRESYKMFRVGMKVITDEGEGQVVYVNLQKHSVKVQLEGGRTKTMQWDVVESVENE